MLQVAGRTQIKNTGTRSRHKAHDPVTAKLLPSPPCAPWPTASRVFYAWLGAITLGWLIACFNSHFLELFAAAWTWVVALPVLIISFQIYFLAQSYFCVQGLVFYLLCIPLTLASPCVLLIGAIAWNVANRTDRTQRYADRIEQLKAGQCIVAMKQFAFLDNVDHYGSRSKLLLGIGLSILTLWCHGLPLPLPMTSFAYGGFW